MSNDVDSQVEFNSAAYLEKYKAEAERDHYGETALMVSGEITEYFETALAAYEAGYARHGLGNFSIQHVGVEPLTLGA